MVIAVHVDLVVSARDGRIGNDRGSPTRSSDGGPLGGSMLAEFTGHHVALADPDATFADGAVVKSKVVRMTLHAFLGDDYQAF